MKKYHKINLKGIGLKMKNQISKCHWNTISQAASLRAMIDRDRSHYTVDRTLYLRPSLKNKQANKGRTASMPQGLAMWKRRDHLWARSTVTFSRIEVWAAVLRPMALTSLKRKTWFCFENTIRSLREQITLKSQKPLMSF